MSYRRIADIPQLESLNDLAFDACYHEIVSNLLLCADHARTTERLTKRRKLNSYSSLLSTNPSFTSEKVIKYVRDRLDYFLIGTMSTKTRAKLVDQFFDTENDSAFMKLELWVFLDSVLDYSFKKLNAVVLIPDPERWSIDKLFNIMSTRSPLIEKLKLNLDGLTYPPETQNIFVKSLQRFKNLTSLSMGNIDDRWTPFLSLLGSCCSKLTKLALESNGSFENKLLLALTAGEQGEIYSEYFSDEPEEGNIHNLKILQAHLSPLCNSLTKLKLEGESENCNCNCQRQHIHNSSMAFLFRHLPNLHLFSNVDCCPCNLQSGYAVEVLHLLSTTETSKDVLRDDQNQLNDAATGETTVNENVNGEKLLKNSSSSEFRLSLCKLGSVNIRSSSRMKAIAALCPSLKEITFIERRLKEDDKISVLQLESICAQLSQIVKVTFYRVHSTIINYVLKVIGHQLVFLRFVSCEIPLFALIPCLQLETLAIGNECLLKPDDDEILSNPEIKSGNFLPHLKNMLSQICLGNKSRLFEEKSTLVKLELNCSHIGTEASDCKWSEVPRYWINLQGLVLNFTTGLRMAMLQQLIPRLKNLKKLHLPSKLRHSVEDKKLCTELKHRFLNGPSQLHLKFDSDWMELNPNVDFRTNLFDSYDSDDSAKVSMDRDHGKCMPLECSCLFYIPIQ